MLGRLPRAWRQAAPSRRDAHSSPRQEAHTPSWEEMDGRATGGESRPEALGASGAVGVSAARFGESAARASESASSFSEAAPAFRRVRLRARDIEFTLAYSARPGDSAPQFTVSYDHEGAYLMAGEPVALSLARLSGPEPQRSEADDARANVLFAEGEPQALNGARPVRDLSLHAADIAVDMLIGYSIEAVERRLVIRTLRRFNGDRRQTAFALGVSVEELMAKLRLFLFVDAAPPPNEGAR